MVLPRSRGRRTANARPLVLAFAALIALGAAAGIVLLLRTPPGPPTTSPTGPGSTELVKAPPTPIPPPTAPVADAAQAHGQELYGRLCSSCHGEKGDGAGPAARFLYPRPRDFSEAKFRIVSTTSGLPTDEDLAHVIRNGMPGSAMLSFGHLSDEDVTALVAQVRRLTREAVTARVRRQLATEGDVDEEVVTRRVANLTVVGPVITMPPQLPAATADSVARGGQLYRTKGCASCHGETAKGDGAQTQFNDDGMPTKPRDLTLGIFKGGADLRQVYARMVRGMPGSPMPGFENQLSPTELIEMSQYIVSLSTPEQRAKVEHRRRALVAARVDGTLPEDIPDTIWQKAKAAPIVVSPLWWRNSADPDLTVDAVHDGKTVAIRLSWRDEKANDRAGRTEEFDDLAAVQLFKGAAEPFLGMGSADAGIDLWQWRAGWQAAGANGDSILDDYPFDMPFYRELTKGREKQSPDFLTARAAGNPIVHDDPKASAASLAAKGFGSTTFRPVASQKVSAKATYDRGRRVVVLRRALAVGPDEGVSLAPGDRCSVAFALWDGEARDRNGQKLVSIWHDLRIE